MRLASKFYILYKREEESGRRRSVLPMRELSVPTAINEAIKDAESRTLGYLILHRYYSF